MKTLNESFTDQEFQELVKAKELLGLNWHDFIMSYATGLTPQMKQKR
jgi:hypothetical protein